MCHPTFTPAVCVNMALDQLALVGHENGDLLVWDLKHKKLVHGANIHEGSITSIIVYDGNVLTASTDRSVKVLLYSAPFLLHCMMHVCLRSTIQPPGS